jgi:NitT/TauT family transport system permease protein
VSATVATPRAGLLGRIRHPYRQGHPGSSRRMTPRQGRIVELLSLLGGLLVWEIVGRLADIPWLPPFSQCLAALWEMIQTGPLIKDLIDSVQALAIGFVISLVLSLVIAFLMSEFDLIDEMLSPYVYAFFLLPSIALAPVFLAIFGIANTTRIAVIVVYCVFYMILNFHTAFTQRDAALVEMADSFQATRMQRIRFLIFPGSLPLVMATVRVGLSRAVKGMINGEQFIAIFGLGGLVRVYGNRFEIDKVFAVILVIVGLAMILDVITRWLDARWTPWAAR